MIHNYEKKEKKEKPFFFGDPKKRMDKNKNIFFLELKIKKTKWRKNKKQKN